jgi:hypothetical protein
VRVLCWGLFICFACLVHIDRTRVYVFRSEVCVLTWFAARCECVRHSEHSTEFLCFYAGQLHGDSADTFISTLVDYTNITRCLLCPGSCIGPDTCTCTDGYEGDDCNTPLCRHLQVTGAVSSCLNGGICSLKDRCDCVQTESVLWQVSTCNCCAGLTRCVLIGAVCCDTRAVSALCSCCYRAVTMRGDCARVLRFPISHHAPQQFCTTPVSSNQPGDRCTGARAHAPRADGLDGQRLQHADVHAGLLRPLLRRPSPGARR